MTFFYPIIPMHEVVPKVVAIAVRMVMTKCMIFWMISFLFMAFGVMSFEFFFPLMKGARGMLILHSFISIEHQRMP